MEETLKHKTTWKKSIWISYTLCDSNFIWHFEKVELRRPLKRLLVVGVWKEGEINWQNTEKFQGSKSFVGYYSDGYVSSNSYSQNQRVNPNINYGLWAIMVFQCRFTYYNKFITLIVEEDEYGTEGTLEISVISTQFCCDSKTALKNKCGYCQRQGRHWGMRKKTDEPLLFWFKFKWAALKKRKERFVCH